MFGTKKEKEYTAPAVYTPEIEEPAVVETPVAKAPARPSTLIGPGIKFTGNIEASEDIEINGRVEGDITSGNKITVTEGGSIKGDVIADTFILMGECKGNAKVANFTKIGPNGSFVGEMFTSTLVTEDGSEFEGTLHLKNARKAVSPATAGSEALSEETI